MKGQQPIFVTNKAIVLNAIDNASGKHTSLLAFGGSTAEELKQMIECVFEKEDEDFIHVSKINNMFKELETPKCPAGANSGIEQIVRTINENKIKVNF